MPALNITSKFEISISNNIDPQKASVFAAKNRCVGLAAPPELIAPLISTRSTLNAQYKIISLIDFPGGKNFAVDKLLRTSHDAYSSDGFDIIPTPNRTKAEQKNEIKSIIELITMQINKLAEIRFVIDTNRSAEELISFLELIKGFPISGLRINTSLGQILDPKADREDILKKYKSSVELIRKFTAVPVKLCGAFDYFMIKELPKINTFGVSLDQALVITKEAEQAQA